MPPRRTRSSTREASTSRRRRREPTPSPPPSPLPWELPLPIHNTRYRTLHKRPVVPSKFFDAYTVHNLGLRGDVNMFVNSIGWTQFAAMQFPTYKAITYEILSTIRSDYHPHIDGDYPCLFFRCLGEDRQLTMGQLNAIFGFPNAGISWNAPAFSPEQAWQQLTGQQEYNPSRSKASLIRNHALRYLHRVMSLSMFGRGESTGVVSRVELLCLWAMANEVQVNTGAWLLRHIMHVATNPKGKICIGGILTVIANAFGFMPVEGVHHIVEGSTLVDIDTLMNMRMCRHMGGGIYRLLDDEGHIIEPPEEEAEEEAEEDEPPPPQDQEPVPDQAEVDMGGFNEPHPAPQPDVSLLQVIDRLERLETRMSRSEDFQAQMMQMMQRNLDATARIEDKLSNLK